MEIIPDRGAHFSSSVHHWIAVIFTSCVLIACITLVSWASLIDVTKSKKVRSDYTQQPTELIVSLDSIEKPLSSIFHSLLPLTWRVGRELRTHHPWMSLLSEEASKPRVWARKLVSLSLKVVGLLFSDSIVNIIGYGKRDASVGFTIAILAVQMVVLASFLHQICESLLVHSFPYISSLTCRLCMKNNTGNSKTSSVAPSPAHGMYPILPTGSSLADFSAGSSVDTVHLEFFRDIFQYWSLIPERAKIHLCGEIL